jgi:branched-chain amino acid transport system substrate-binding protein
MARRWLRIWSLTMALALFAGILAGCGSGTQGSGGTPAKIVIKIGTDFPTTGGDASAGKPPEDGAHLAVDEANAANFIPGYTLVFDPRDDVGVSGVHDPSVGATNVTSLANDAQVAGIIGPLNSSVAEAELPLTNEKGIAQISPSNTNTCLTQNAPDTGCTGPNNLLPKVRPTGKVTYFRIATTDVHQGGVAADFAARTLHYKNVYVIDDTEAYGVGLALNFIKEFTADGGHILGHDSIQSSTDYTGELQKIAGLKPDAIYFAGNDSTGGTPIRKQMEDVPGLQNTPYLGGDAINTTAFAQAIGVGHGGPVYSTVAAIDVTKLPSAAGFIQKYQSVYGPLGAYSAGGYDCARILINAIKAAIDSGAKPPANSDDQDTANSFRQAVINALMKTDYNGVTGHQSFDANGDTTNKTISIYQLADVNGQPGWKYVTAETLT